MSKVTFKTGAFYTAIDDTRHFFHLTWAQVAEQSGVSASCLSRLKRGREVTLDNLAALIDWAGLDFNDFIE
jgi:transcriptional regulator with XRE-family HTH domain